MTDWENRLRTVLEPILAKRDPRPELSAYHDMPYAIFWYPPEDEFALREELALLRTRLGQSGKVVTTISLADCLHRALEKHSPIDRLAQAERQVGLDPAVRQVHETLAQYEPLDQMVEAAMPPKPDPFRNVVFIVRTGALFPFYRTFALLEQLRGRIRAPTVLFYPGVLDGAVGLRFMGVLDAEHNYRPKIF